MMNDSTTWSVEETEVILSDYWETGGSVCPQDNVPLLITGERDSKPVMAGGEYLLGFNCPSCGKAAQLRRSDDPLRHEFRKYTSAETAVVFTGVQQHRMFQKCPVCRKFFEILVRTSPPGFPVTQVRACCFRCGQDVLIDKPNPTPS